MRAELQKELEQNWKDYCHDEEAAFAVLRRKFSQVDRTQFHDDWSAVRDSKQTSAEKLGQDGVKSKSPETATTTNTDGGQETKTAKPSSGDGVPSPVPPSVVLDKNSKPDTKTA